MQKRQLGQALTEFLIAATFFLVPLFLAIAALGKFIDVQHTTHMAARYAAWERTVWVEADHSRFQKHNAPNTKSAVDIQNEIALRIVNNHSSTGTDEEMGQPGNGIDPMWHDAAGKPFLDIDNPSLSARTVMHTPDSSVIALIGKVSIPNIIGSLAPPVPTDTLAVAQVSLTGVAKHSDVYHRLWPASLGEKVGWDGLDYRATSAILSNTWYANTRTGTLSMVNESVPTANALGTMLKGMVSAPLMAWDPTIASRLDLGKVGVDVVPADRLK